MLTETDVVALIRLYEAYCDEYSPSTDAIVAIEKLRRMLGRSKRRELSGADD